MSWDASQRAMLEAMGYALYRPVAAPSAGAADPVPSRATAAGPAAGAADADRLLAALRRAAGGRDPTSLPLPPLDRLRTDAAAKRALWPRLRALRRH